MAEQSKQAQPSIALETQDSRCLAARVILPEGVEPQTLSVHLLVSLARERGVEVTGAAEQKLTELVGRYLADGKPVNEVFILATPPRHGEHGYIEWSPGFNPEKPDENEHNPGDERVDFYSHHSFVTVHKEDHIATIHPPTEGTDGRDVTGRTIAANAGRAFPATLGESVLKLADGRLLAQLDGRLCFDSKRLWIDPVLDIKGGVDFSTGNIDFQGDVVIQRDIRDRFTVRARGNVTIEGLIDASHIDCTGNLTARRGVAGRDEGTLDVGGDAHIGYIDRAKGHIGGSLYLTRELMHSTIAIGGNLVSDLGVVIGGRVAVRGDARLADLGAESEAPTEFRLGSLPADGSPAGQAEHRIELLKVSIATMDHELAALRATAGPQNPKAAERATELTFEISEAHAEIAKLASDHPQLAAVAASAPCRSTLVVLRQIHGRVTLIVGPHTVVFASKVKGPLRIWLDGGRVVCQLGEGTPQPINALAGVTDRSAA
ncbi:MAG: DUF342 domain-containing protein [Phycisphaerales bacterium]|nr:DUF342 domain-containing protein [Phycisphaerales bacterium]